MFTAFAFNANAVPFVDTFDQFNSSIWSCEYSCPTVSGGTAKFHVKKGIAEHRKDGRPVERWWAGAEESSRAAVGGRPSRAPGGGEAA
ncbi:hypothetical protein [Cystobacter fuscus]|uniref:hypothetical protein n=1 Tax=Cystobacter fuscus TaxID=43 RepID=UPI0012DE832E|nr:hypothetical protein [Cystobacter fuscus]